MKKLLAAILMCAMLFGAASCGSRKADLADNGADPTVFSDPVAGDDSETDREIEPAGTAESTGASAERISSFHVRVTSLSENQADPYRELIYMTDGDFCADGKLMFYGVSDILPEIADLIPSVSLDSSTQLELSAEENAEIGNSKYQVYDSDYQFLLGAESLQEIYALRKSVLKEKEVYIYFTVTLKYQSAERCEGCFIKTDFDAYDVRDLEGKFDIHVVSSDGTSVAPYTSIAYLHSTHIDCALTMSMYHSVPELIERYQDEIPTAVIGENSTIITKSDSTARISSPSGLDLYNKNYEKIGQAENLGELYEKGNEFGEDEIYAVFTVNMNVGSKGSRSDLCFVKIMF